MSKREAILEILHTIRPSVNFEEAYGIIDNGILDSLEFLSLITELGTHFDVEIDAEEITSENFCTVETIEKMITRLGEKK